MRADWYSHQGVFPKRFINGQEVSESFWQECQETAQDVINATGETRVKLPSEVEQAWKCLHGQHEQGGTLILVSSEQLAFCQHCRCFYMEKES